MSEEQRVDQIELEGVTAFAEQIAKQLTEDPGQRALIVEGMRATFLRKQHEHPATANRLFDERGLPQRFFTEAQEDCLCVWDFFILLNSVLRQEWLADGSIRLPNVRRDAEPITIPSNVAEKYAEYLALVCPGALPVGRSLMLSTEASLCAGSRSAQDEPESKSAE